LITYAIHEFVDQTVTGLEEEKYLPLGTERLGFESRC